MRNETLADLRDSGYALDYYGLFALFFGTHCCCLHETFAKTMNRWIQQLNSLHRKVAELCQRRKARGI
ncbi:hypothetical protein [Sporolactobacillus nakayamae]|uniref:Uncharacterized protein n=1 Tax=Sporolactobacillus nakayamae TaxID=269670 RepID=A0A1I2WG37_9BACL|nr:hypothetical protein [Sporolactobacillus nakayamae]SFH00263.1 hypothetical protein SAMN02982927_03543 [Sporolactobacillus nakayamae]